MISAPADWIHRIDPFLALATWSYKLDPFLPSRDQTSATTKPAFQRRYIPAGTMAPPLLLGISGPSSSGKTTLSRLLRDIFPPKQLTIVHLDDFYLTDAEIPVKNGVQDWDCLESLDLKGLRETLKFIRKEGRSPDWLVSKEDQNSVGEHGVSERVVGELKREIEALLSEHPDWKERRICIVDGFLLFSGEMKEIRELFDVRLFLRTSYETAKKRREARSGYVTLEGFWEDPPGYVDDIVWPNYVKDHKFLFEDEDVNGDLDEDVLAKTGIYGMPREAEGDMEVCLRWSVAVLKDVIKGRDSEKDVDMDD